MAGIGVIQYFNITFDWDTRKGFFPSFPGKRLALWRSSYDINQEHPERERANALMTRLHDRVKEKLGTMRLSREPTLLIPFDFPRHLEQYVWASTWAPDLSVTYRGVLWSQDNLEQTDFVLCILHDAAAPPDTVRKSDYYLPRIKEKAVLDHLKRRPGASRPEDAGDAWDAIMKDLKGEIIFRDGELVALLFTRD